MLKDGICEATFLHVFMVLYYFKIIELYATLYICCQNLQTVFQRVYKYLVPCR